jgi:hypothetical protein
LISPQEQDKLLAAGRGISRVNALRYLRWCKNTHAKWFDYLKNYAVPERDMDLVGDSESHRRAIEMYGRIEKLISEDGEISA